MVAGAHDPNRHPEAAGGSLHFLQRIESTPMTGGSQLNVNSRRRRSMTGATAASFHEGSRSEVLADYLFSAWGTVTPARRQSDYGLDLYCTLTERVGQRGRVREYFSVQVKSSDHAVWEFNDTASVKWLVEHPLPLFLSTVNKKEGIVRVYHTIARFQIWALGALPDRVKLTPGEGYDGQFDPGAGLPICSLSAPILEVGLVDLSDDDRMEELKEVLSYWVALDRDNCELVRAGLLRFRRPSSYKTNKASVTDSQMDLSFVDDQILERGLFRLAEGIECIGGQLAHPYRGNHAFGLEAALLLDRIQKEFPGVFQGKHFWQMRVPGLLNFYVVNRLNQALGGTGGYHYSGLDAVEAALAGLPLVQKYLKT
jgi:hypothetical protein